MIRAQSGQTIGAQLVNATSGAAFSGSVTVYVTGDAGTQAIGSVGSGAATSEGNGYFSYRPSSAETNYDLIAFTFIGTGAVPATVQVFTITAAAVAQLATGTGTSSATTFNARSVITDAFMDLGIFAPGEQIPDADAQFALRALNQVVSRFQNHPRTFPFRRREVFDVVAAQSTYTMGPGGDFDTDRPTALLGAGLLLPSASATTGAIEVPRALLTDDAYEAIAAKDLQSSMWTAVYFKPTYAAGLAAVILWPVPDAATYDLVLYWGNALSGFVNLTALYDFPPGVGSVFRYCTAETIASGYGKEWTPLLERLKNRALAEYTRQNYLLTDLAVDPAMTRGPRRGGYDINAGNG